MIKVVVLPTVDDVGRYGAGLIEDLVSTRTSTVLGIATGSSPLPIYGALSRRDTSHYGHVSAFALDEYVGLERGHPQSYRSVIDHDFTEPLGLNPLAVHVPDGNAEDLDAECRAYERYIVEAGGIDLQILGIGDNGHIGFNEPFSSFSSRTRVAALAVQTRQANARFFDYDMERVPQLCITQGIATVLAARSVVLVAQGESKASAVAAAIGGQVTTACPASALQLHDRATFVIDEAAASGLSLNAVQSSHIAALYHLEVRGDGGFAKSELHSS